MAAEWEYRADGEPVFRAYTWLSGLKGARALAQKSGKKVTLYRREVPGDRWSAVSAFHPDGREEPRFG